MAIWSLSGLWLSLALNLSTGLDGGQPVLLPPVVVPVPQAPEAEPSPQSPLRRDPTGSTTVVELGQRRGEAKDTAELFAEVPGTVTTDSGGLGQSKSLSVRGASTNGVLVLLDGIPLSGAGGMTDLSRIPAAAVERFEVLRGAVGARYGSGALGGVVNVVTRRPESGARGFAELSLGSFGTGRGQLGAAGTLLGGQGLVLLHGARSRGDFSYLFDALPSLSSNLPERRQRENNQAQQAGGLLKYRRPVEVAGAPVDVQALLEGFAESRGLAGTAQNPTADAHQRSHRLAAGLELQRRLASGWELSAHLYGLREGLSLSGASFSPGIDERRLTAGGELSVQGLPFEHHAAGALVQLSHEGMEDSAADDPSWARLGAMVWDDWLLAKGALVLGPSFRVDLTGPFLGLSPKLGATLALPSGLELRANVGQAHRAPSFLELYVRQGSLLPNPDLRPERALYADAALSHRGERTQATVGGFYSLYQDLVAYELYPPFLAKPFNFAAASVWGVEAEAQAQPRSFVSAQASYTLLFSRNLRDDPRYYKKQLPYRPRHKLHARVSAGPKWLQGRLELVAQSEQFLNRTQTVALPARAFLGAGLTGTVLQQPRVELSLELKNLLDAQSADLDGYPLPGRAVYLTLSLSLDSK